MLYIDLPTTEEALDNLKKNNTSSTNSMGHLNNFVIAFIM